MSLKENVFICVLELPSKVYVSSLHEALEFCWSVEVWRASPSYLSTFLSVVQNSQSSNDRKWKWRVTFKDVFSNFSNMHAIYEPESDGRLHRGQAVCVKVNKDINKSDWPWWKGIDHIRYHLLSSFPFLLPTHTHHTRDHIIYCHPLTAVWPVTPQTFAPWPLF